MLLVYGLTVIITASWLLRMIKERKCFFKTTPLDIPLVFFLLANILSTIFSVDQHTSIWGYYSRSNGGLLSTISYLLLYWALVSNFTAEYAGKFTKAAVFGGVVVALYAIPEHFGISPSCLILTHQADAACWVQDVQARVFATLGQPNWLAAYLAMLIFPAIYFAVTAKNKFSSILYVSFSVLLYLAFTFTYSRGASLGLLAGAGIFAIGYLFYLRSQISLNNLKLPGIILITFLFTTLLFGSALTNFKLLSQFAPPPRPTLSLNTSSGTQLENGGTESGKIRLIVWKGAIDIFKHYPIFGSGVETFAYTYYNFRPMEHNMVSESDFLYNKAHNEFLNYLATTGASGFLSYIALIITFIVWSIKFLWKKHNFTQTILVISILGAYISYLVQNFFGFSVVIIALFFYLFPALAFLSTDSVREISTPRFLRFLSSFLYRRPLYYKASITFVLMVAIFLVYKLFSYWQADAIFASGNAASEAGKPGMAYNKIFQATQLNPGEPFYQSELSYSAASSAVAVEEEDATLSAELKDQAANTTSKLLEEHPKNVSFYRTAIRTYYMISTIDKTYTQKTLEIVDQTIALAPTDPKLPYNKALILGQMGKNKEAIQVLEKVIQMKPNYKEAYLALASFYNELKENEKSVDTLNRLLKIIPSDPQALDQLQKIKQSQ